MMIYRQFDKNIEKIKDISHNKFIIMVDLIAQHHQPRLNVKIQNNKTRGIGMNYSSIKKLKMFTLISIERMYITHNYLER